MEIENVANLSARLPITDNRLHSQAVEGVNGRSDDAPLSPLCTNEGGTNGSSSLVFIFDVDVFESRSMRSRQSQNDGGGIGIVVEST